MDSAAKYLGYKKASEPDTKTEVAEIFPKEKRTTVYAWEAQSRPAIQQLNKKTTKTLMIIGIIVAILMLAMQEFMLILVVLSFVFVIYMIGQIPAETVKLEITNQGVVYNGTFYAWDELVHFFFIDRQGLEICVVDVKNGIPARLFMTMNPGDHEKIKGILEQHLTFLEEEPKTFADKTFEKVVGKLELEK